MTNRARVGLALFLVFQGLFGLTASGRVDRIADEFEVYSQVESLVDRGSLAIPQVPEAVFFGKKGVDGQPYAPYGPGSALLSLPHHLLGRALAWVAGVPRDPRFLMPWVELVAGVTSLASTTWAALAVLGLFVLALELGASQRRALLCALLLGGCTLLWTYATQFFSEPQSAALLIWSLFFLQRRWVMAAALAIFALLLVKASNIILAPVLVVAAVWPRETNGEWSPFPQLARWALPVLIGVGAAGLVRLELNVMRFGNPFELGYSWEGVLRPGEQHQEFMLSELPRGLFGLLLSPGKSLLLFSPPVVLAVFRLKDLYQRAPHLAATCVAALVTSLLFFGCYSYWEGGYCYGPRFLVPILPLLLLPLAAGPLPRRGALIACAVLGVVVQLAGTLVSFTADQARGGRPAGWVDPYYTWHAPEDPAVPEGRPLNRYRLSYTPFRPSGYPRLLGSQPWDLLINRWERTERAAGELLWPGWLSWSLPLGFLLLLVGSGVWLQRSVKDE